MSPQPPRDLALSPNFWLSEFVVSQTATRLGIDNTPPPEVVSQLYTLAPLLELVRGCLGHEPIVITSGYRCPALNAAVGSSDTSAHLLGLAADFVCPGYGVPLQVARQVVNSLIPFDQLIFEHGWVHIACTPFGKRPRRAVLTAQFTPGQPTRYTRGIAG